VSRDATRTESDTHREKTLKNKSRKNLILLWVTWKGPFMTWICSSFTATPRKNHQKFNHGKKIFVPSADGGAMTSPWADGPEGSFFQ
jgi:hypothetical protein